MYRSRLARLEEKRDFRKATILTLGTILVLVGAVTLGIPVLVRVAMFVGDLKSNGVVDKTDLIPPGPPQIITSFEATNNADQAISGLGEPGTTVYLTLNSQPVGNVVTGEDGVWKFVKVSLKDESNTFEAVAVDTAGNKSVNSKPVTVLYMTAAPKLEIEKPQDSQEVSGQDSRVEVKGMSDGNVRLTLNDRLIIVASDGNFSSSYNLNPGDNQLVFKATDKAGNETTKEIFVKYSP